MNACESLCLQGLELTWARLDHSLPVAYKSMVDDTTVNLSGLVPEKLLVPLCDLFPDIELQSPTEESNKKLKIKYSCPVCECNVWGKPELSIVCGDCKTSLVAQIIQEDVATT